MRYRPERLPKARIPVLSLLVRDPVRVRLWCRRAMLLRRRVRGRGSRGSRLLLSRLRRLRLVLWWIRTR
ncbi:hypothetical protein, partial [Nocardia sp. NPDC005998]|uniref:hypothetical protein n=1 Tax=Nocardia sp. NPDC005998 TaxID=3156894 RepID=UPI0033A61691